MNNGISTTKRHTMYMYNRKRWVTITRPTVPLPSLQLVQRPAPDAHMTLSLVSRDVYRTHVMLRLCPPWMMELVKVYVINIGHVAHLERRSSNSYNSY